MRANNAWTDGRDAGYVNPRSLSTDTVETLFSIVQALYGNPTLLTALKGWAVLQWEQAKKFDPSRPYGWRGTARPKYLHHRLDTAVPYKPRSALPSVQRAPTLPPLRAAMLTVRRFFVDVNTKAVHNSAILADDAAAE